MGGDGGGGGHPVVQDASLSPIILHVLLQGVCPTLNLEKYGSSEKVSDCHLSARLDLFMVPSKSTKVKLPLCDCSLSSAAVAKVSEIESSHKAWFDTIYSRSYDL